MDQYLAKTRTLARKKLDTLTLDEKVSLLTAADFWRTKSIPKKNIPSLKTTDGPNGARGEIFTGGTKAALFPCGTSLAATWNKDLVYDVASHLADEAKARSAQVLLAPTVCIHRHPLGGRNFEAFSEDPILTGKLAVQYIRGLQDHGVAATIKHFVGNEQETKRMTINCIIEERPLREVYLRPFEIAIREASPWAVMSSYNAINGTHSDMSSTTLKNILRKDWSYDGTVISDWSGINSTIESLIAGCDIEFPFSTNWRLQKLIDAVNEGSIELKHINKAAENVLALVQRVRGDDTSKERPERENNCEKTRKVILSAAQEGITLLKNDNILPLCREAAKIAVIGPNANRAVAHGGGSASLNPYYTTTPLESIRKLTGNVLFAQGCFMNKWLPLASEVCTRSDGKIGVDIEWYAGDEFRQAPVVVESRPSTDLLLWDSAPVAKVGEKWSAVVTTTLTPKLTGIHTVSFMTVGPGQLYLNGELAIDLWNWTDEGETLFEGSMDHLYECDMEAGKSVQLKVKLTNELRPLSKQKELGITHKYGGCRIGFRHQDQVDHIQEATEIAEKVDVAVVVIGLDSEWESEGYDRKTMDLPGDQDRLVEAVAKANPRTVVVNQSGSPVHMPWAEQVPAIIQAWYQGQESGTAMADILFGIKNPSGKLPTTFPKRIEHTPAWTTWPGIGQTASYEEGLFVGYKHYDNCGIKPLFPFGHGLSYTTFQYGKPAWSNNSITMDGHLEVRVPICNTGSRFGGEIVQLYIHDERSRLPRPKKELAAFGKVFLKPGESKEVIMTLDKYSVGYYDDTISAWIAEEGAFHVLIGASSSDIRQSATVYVERSFQWQF